MWRSTASLPLPPALAFKRQISRGVRVRPPNDQNARVHVLMARAAEQHAVGGSPRPPAAAGLQMMHVRPAALTGPTAPAISAPHLSPYGSADLHARGLPLPLRDDARLRAGNGTEALHAPRPDAVIVCSTQIRTPGICVAPLSARTTRASFV